MVPRLYISVIGQGQGANRSKTTLLNMALHNSRTGGQQKQDSTVEYPVNIMARVIADRGANRRKTALLNRTQHNSRGIIGQRVNRSKTTLLNISQHNSWGEMILANRS